MLNKIKKRYAAQKRSNFGKEGTLFEKQIELEKSLMQSTLANGREIKGARIVKRMLCSGSIPSIEPSTRRRKQRGIGAYNRPKGGWVMSSRKELQGQYRKRGTNKANALPLPMSQSVFLFYAASFMPSSLGPLPSKCETSISLLF